MLRPLTSIALLVGLLAASAPSYAASAPLTNADIVRLAHNGIGDSVLASMVRSQPGTYTLTPDAILAIKKAGAGDETIKAMLQSADPKLTAATQVAAPGTLAARVSVSEGTHHRVLSPALAKIAQSQLNGGGVSAGVDASVLGSYAGSALSLIPGVGMLGGIAGGIGSLFGHRSKAQAPQIHQVWALEGPHSASELATTLPAFDVEYDKIPGIDPDRFEPVLLHLVATKDNWRLVGASKTTYDASKSATTSVPGGAAIDSITEERIATHASPLGRGRMRLTPDSALAGGEYAIVLRPLDIKAAAASDGSGQTLSSVIASVWDFSIHDATQATKS